jgi:hypothetical protein
MVWVWDSISYGIVRNTRFYFVESELGKNNFTVRLPVTVEEIKYEQPA